MSIATPGFAIVATALHGSQMLAEGSLIERFQTLLTGILAIIAALMGGRYVAKQINASDQQERQRIARKLRAAQAVAPLSLSELSNYCRNCGSMLLAVYSHKNSAGEIPVGTPVANVPKIPRNTIDDLRAIAEHAPPEVSRAAARVLANLQIQHSRLSSLSEEIQSERSLVAAETIADLGILTAQVSAGGDRFFVYCRELEDKLTGSTWEGLYSALHNTGWDIDDHSEVYGRARRYVDEGYFGKR